MSFKSFHKLFQEMIDFEKMFISQFDLENIDHSITKNIITETIIRQFQLEWGQIFYLAERMPNKSEFIQSYPKPSKGMYTIRFTQVEVYSEMNLLYEIVSKMDKQLAFY